MDRAAKIRLLEAIRDGAPRKILSLKNPLFIYKDLGKYYYKTDKITECTYEEVEEIKKYIKVIMIENGSDTMGRPEEFFNHNWD